MTMKDHISRAAPKGSQFTMFGILLCSCLVAVLCSEENSTTVDDDGNSTTVTTPSPVVTAKCGWHVELPPPHKEGQLIVVTSDDNDNATNPTNCTWIVPPRNSHTGTAFAYYNSLSRPYDCLHDGVLVFYDLDPATGNQSLIGHWCGTSSGMFAGRPGFPTLVQYQGLKENVTIFQNTSIQYMPYSFTELECPSGLLELNATINETRIPVVPSLLHLPNGMNCQWVFTTTNKGVLHLKLMSFNYGGVCRADDYFLIMDVGHPAMAEPLKVEFCDALNYHHVGVSGETILSFHSGNKDGSPTFTIGYWEDSPEQLCPTTTQRLQAVLGQVDAFKGVNHPEEYAEDRDCSWEIWAPYTNTVVKLLNMTSVDYLADCNSGDVLTVDGYPGPLDMCMSSEFPIWSSDISEKIQFHADKATPRRQFIVYYTAVYKGQCQGQVRSVKVTSQSQTIVESGVPDLRSDGTNCRWHIFAEDPDAKIEVTIPQPPSSNDTFSCLSTWLYVLEGPSNARTGLLAGCSTDVASNTLTYQSRSNTVVVVFNRSPRAVGHNVRWDLEMKVRAVGGATGGAGSVRPTLGIGGCLVLLYSVLVFVNTRA